MAYPHQAYPEPVADRARVLEQGVGEVVVGEEATHLLEQILVAVAVEIGEGVLPGGDSR